MSEVLLNDETIKRFRARYTAAFGGNTVDDPLYGAVSAGQRFPGVEHWLPFFYEHLTALARLHRRRALRLRRPGARGLRRAPDADRGLLRGPRAGADRRSRPRPRARPTSRCRRSCSTRSAPIPTRSPAAQVLQLTPFVPPDERTVEDAGGQLAPSFAAERQAQDVNLFEAVVERCSARSSGPGGRPSSPAGPKARATAWRRCSPTTASSNPRMAENWRDAETTSAATTALVVLGARDRASRPTICSSSPSRTSSASACCARSARKRRPTR